MDTITTVASPFPLQMPSKQNAIAIKDGMWFLRVSQRKSCDNYAPEKFSFPGWEALFGNNQPLCIEYCSGNGAWIAAKAQGDTSANWVGVEYKFSRACKIWGQAKRKGLNNLFVINGEAVHATTYVATGSVDAIYINFPDPWPKRRHAKYRLISPHFALEMARILKPSGTLTFVTDDRTYSEWSLDILCAMPEFASVYPEPYYTTEWPGYGGSFFDELWRQKGREILYHRFTRT